MQTLSESILKSALETIPVSELDYNEWLKIGMGLKTSGCDLSVWDEWSRADNRYHERECAKKWKSFNRGEVTAGTIYHYAKKYGWSFPDAELLDWDSEIEYDGGFPKTEKSASNGMTPSMQLVKFLETLYKPGEIVGITANKTDVQLSDGKYHPATNGRFDRTAGELIAELKAHPDDIAAAIGGYNENCGGWIRMNPMDGKGGSDENVVAFRYALVESDEMSIKEQEKKYLEYKLPIATLVYSGGKSMHAVVRIDAKDAKEYAERLDFLYSFLKAKGFSADGANKNPSRHTRMPGLKRGDKMQELRGCNLGCSSWNEWFNSVSDKTKGMADYLNEDFQNDIEKCGEVWSTGFECLDNAWGGLRAGLTVLGAAPGSGKTTLAWQMADHIAKDGGYVIYFTIEQTYIEMACKSLARYAALEDYKKHGFEKNPAALCASDIMIGVTSSLVEKAKEKYIHDVGNRIRVVEGMFETSVDDIVRYVKDYISRYNVKPVVFIDYLQILESDTEQPIRQSIDKSVKKLRRLAMNGFPVVVISSFNRANYYLTGDFESFKESGGIEFTADRVCTMELSCIQNFDDTSMGVNQRRKTVKAEQRKTPRNIRFCWHKNRGGVATGECNFRYYPAHNLFEDAKKQL